jgi:hypothetical protein
VLNSLSRFVASFFDRLKGSNFEYEVGVVPADDGGAENTPKTKKNNVELVVDGLQSLQSELESDESPSCVETNPHNSPQTEASNSATATDISVSSMIESSPPAVAETSSSTSSTGASADQIALSPTINDADDAEDVESSPTAISLTPFFQTPSTPSTEAEEESNQTTTPSFDPPLSSASAASPPAESKDSNKKVDKGKSSKSSKSTKSKQKN